MKPPFKFLSVCSGIDAASVAFNPLGWQCVGFSEIEKFPSAVLKHHYPDVPNFGDMTKYHEWPIELRFDLLCGGPPCQGFSLAGLRKGLVDPRSQLSLTFVEIAARYRPRWFLYENVPGILSSEGGSDFATLLAAFTGREVPVPQDGWRNSGAIDGIGDAYGVAWRVLDAQFTGVPQRRRRVFIVGYLGDWRRASAVLFEPESLQGSDPPSNTSPVSVCLTARGAGSLDDRETYIVEDECIRHMTPLEFGRLQGFPDGITEIPWSGRSSQKCPDGPQYRAFGNSWAVPCVRWIGERIALVETLSSH